MMIRSRTYSSLSSSMNYLLKSKWPEGCSMLEHLPEIQTVKSSKVLKDNDLMLLERAVNICEATTGNNSVYTGNCLALLCKASAACGDFTRGKRSAEKLSESFSISEPLQRIHILQKGGLITTQLKDPEEDVTMQQTDANWFSVTEDARRVLQTFDNTKSDPSLLSKLLNSLESNTWEQMVLPDAPYENISLKAHIQVAKYEHEVLLAMTLAQMACVVHKQQKQAVTAEGLFRTSIEKLKTLRADKHCCLRYAAESALNQVVYDYASLLDDWENRENEAKKLRDSVQSTLPVSRMYIVNLKGWDRI